ncbi:hypothetical protein G6F57_015214 [Rhizopus arrhizus]|nr:hypothetical protein G6F57_015214 [Rhizopus arrhizus]
MTTEPADGSITVCHLRVGIRGGDAVAAGQPARNRLAQRRVALGGRVHGQAAHVVADRLRGPEGQGAHQPGRVVAHVLREHAGAHHEHVRHIPALQVLVDHAFLGVRAHDRAAGVVRALVDARVIARALLTHGHEVLLRIHGLGHGLHALAHVAQHVELVVMPVERHAQQRLAIGVLVRRIQRQIGVAVRHHRTGNADGHEALVRVLHTRFPGRAPAGGARRRRRLLDGTAAVAHVADAGAAQKAQRAVVELVAVQVVHAHAARAGAHEGVQLGALGQQHVHRAVHLVCVVLADHAFIGLRVIRLADTGEQQEAHVVHLVGRQDHQIGRLVDFPALGVDVRHADGLLAGGIQIDLDHLRMRAQLEIRLLQQHWQDGRLRRRLRGPRRTP